MKGRAFLYVDPTVFVAFLSDAGPGKGDRIIHVEHRLPEDARVVGVQWVEGRLAMLIESAEFRGDAFGRLPDGQIQFIRPPTMHVVWCDHSYQDADMLAKGFDLTQRRN
jgi:hypothetical protein